MTPLEWGSSFCCADAGASSKKADEDKLCLHDVEMPPRFWAKLLKSGDFTH